MWMCNSFLPSPFPFNLEWFFTAQSQCQLDDDDDDGGSNGDGTAMHRRPFSSAVMISRPVHRLFKNFLFFSLNMLLFFRYHRDNWLSFLILFMLSFDFYCSLPMAVITCRLHNWHCNKGTCCCWNYSSIGMFCYFEREWTCAADGDRDAVLVNKTLFTAIFDRSAVQFAVIFIFCLPHRSLPRTIARLFANFIYLTRCWCR